MSDDPKNGDAAADRAADEVAVEIEVEGEATSSRGTRG